MPDTHAAERHYIKSIESDPIDPCKKLIQQAASQDYDIPGSVHTRVAAKTIEGWYYKYRREHLDGLQPKVRRDRGVSKLPLDIQGSSSLPEEFRSFETQYAGQIWYGDVMHGPKLMIDGRMRKVYLVSLMDDASRLLAHSAFCLGETALDIEGVLKQAVLKRGLPMKLVIDNGAAYRSGSLKAICARLGIHMIFCRPYAPEGKGKLERWHRTFRNQFLSELDSSRIHDLNDLNTRLWAWIEQVYHRRVHTSLKGLTPLARYQQDLARIRLLGSKALQLDELFYHRVSRKVRRDGTVAWDGNRFEVDYVLAGKQVQLVIDPHAGEALRSITAKLNPHRYQVIYTAETDFGRLDIYRSLALALGLEPAYRRASLWRDIKSHIEKLAEDKQVLPVWMIDEAQNLPPEFFRDFPAFLNFAFDSRNLMTVWLTGHPMLAHTLDRAPYAALSSRIHARIQLQPIIEAERFSALLTFAMQQAGCQQQLISDSGMELLRQSSRGLPRHAGRILTTAMRMAVPKGLNHLPDDLLQQAIESLR